MVFGGGDFGRGGALLNGICALVKEYHQKYFSPTGLPDRRETVHTVIQGSNKADLMWSQPTGQGDPEQRLPVRGVPHGAGLVPALVPLPSSVIS